MKRSFAGDILDPKREIKRRQREERRRKMEALQKELDAQEQQAHAQAEKRQANNNRSEGAALSRLTESPAKKSVGFQRHRLKDPPPSVEAKPSVPSPQSSVSCSQATLPKSQAVARHAAHPPAKMTALERKKWRRQQQDLSSSSDSDGNDRARKNVSKAIHKDSDNFRYVKGGHPPSTEFHTERRKREIEYDCSGEEEQLSTARAREFKKPVPSKAKARRRRMSNSSTSSDSDGEEKKSWTVAGPSKPEMNQRPVARNPLAFSRQFQSPPADPTKTASLVAAASRSASLWSDHSDEEVVSESSPKKNAVARSKKTTGSAKKSPAAKAHKTKIRVELPENVDDLDDSALKPEFSNPLFGPWALEPLVLPIPELDPEEEEAKSDDLKYHLAPIRERCTEETLAVPPSVARYLAVYQKAGIEFMYRTIFLNGGGILGDDMGTGKTVQVLALLSALLKKSGTDRDKKELYKRKKLANEWTSKEEIRHTELLQQGIAYRESDAPPLPNYLPSWAPVLILAPSSILNNWITDGDRWGYFAMNDYVAKNDYTGVDHIRTGASEVLLVSHKLFEMENHFAALNKIPWKLVIVDEHHKLKNYKSKAAINLRTLRDTHCVPVIGLTGTVMQNDHRELHCLLDLAAKNLVGDWSFFRLEFADPIKHSRAKDASAEMVERGKETSNELSRLMSKAYLRRTKEEVLQDELPEKDERIVFCELSDLQKRIYQNMLELADMKMLRLSADPCDCGINKPFFKYLKKMTRKKEKLELLRANKKRIRRRAQCCYRTPIISLEDKRINPNALIWRSMHENDVPCDPLQRPTCPYCVLFPVMSRLMKVASHVALIQPMENPENLDDPKKQEEAAKELAFARAFIPRDCVPDLPGGSYIRQNSICNDHFSLSGKMKVLHRLLTRIEEKGGRVLVFSASTQTLDLIQDYLKSRGKSFLRMDGSTDREQRKELADEFSRNRGILVFLLSTRAMGLGLNLTSANYVIIFDPEWNPSNDSQAQDRAYRLGQMSNVVVFRLIAQGTIEEQKYLRQVYKTQLKNETIVEVDQDDREVAARLFRGVAGDDTRRGELFGIANLLRFKDGTFMNYGTQTREEARFGENIYNVETLLSNAQGNNDGALGRVMGEDQSENDLAAALMVNDEDDQEEEEGVADLVGLTENALPDAPVGQEEMLGAESQNMFDFYGNDEDDNDDDDAASEEDPGEDTGGIVVPRGALQVAGESGGESLASSSRTLHGELPQMFLRQGTVDYPSAQPGEATGLNENPVVVQHRLRDPGAMGGQPIMEVLVPPSSQGVSRPDEPSVHNRRENFSENVGSNSPLDAASKRLVEAWAEANSMAVSDVLPREQFASAENVESRPETSQTNTVADDAKAQHMENEICQDSKVVGQTTPTSEQSTAKRTISEIANSSSGQGHPCPSQADDDRKLDSDPDRIRGGSPGSSFVPSPDNDTNAAENELVRTRFARQPGQSEEAVPHEGIARLVGHDGPVSSVIFSADAKYCLTGSYDRTVRLWNPLRLDPAHPPPKNLLRNPDGGIRMQSLPHSLPIQVYGDGVTHPVSAIAIDEQSTTILTGSEKTLVVHDVVTGQSQRRLQGHVGRINAVAINRDAQIYLSASYDATVRIWDGRSRSFEPIQILKEAKDSVTAVHFVQSDSLTLIRTASVDGVIRSYDVRMGMLQFSDVGDPITGMCVTSNPHHCVVNCLDGALRLCDLEQGKVLKHYTGGHKAGQYSLDCVVSAADDYVVTGSEDGSAVFYDMSSGRVAQVLEGHRHPTCSVACHGLLSSVAVSASYDGTSVVWGHNDSLMQW